MSRSHLNILYQADENYAPFCGVSMFSLFENNKDAESIDVYVIDDGISDANKYKMLGMAHGFGPTRTVAFMHLDGVNEKLDALGAVKYRGSYATYMRLFAFGALPGEIDRLIYLDCDVIVEASLKELNNIELSGYVAGAVRDGISYQNKLSLGFPASAPWFNCGVLLVDVDAWKNSGAEEVINDVLKSGRRLIAHDQDLLNISLHNKIKTLDPKFNLAPHFLVYSFHAYMKAFPQRGFYDNPQVFKEAVENPVICHFQRFLGTQPWHSNAIHPYTVLFDKYLAMSPWHDLRKQPAALAESPTIKIERMIYKILPHDVFVRLQGIALKRYFASKLKGLAAGNVDDID